MRKRGGASGLGYKQTHGGDGYRLGKHDVLAVAAWGNRDAVTGRGRGICR